MDKIVSFTLSVISIIFIYNVLIYVYPDTKNKHLLKTLCGLVLITCIALSFKNSFNVDFNFKNIKQQSYEDEIVNVLEEQVEQDILKNTGIKSKVKINKNDENILFVESVSLEEDSSYANQYVREKYECSEIY
ncbi:MAG: hypothetical protein PUD72_00355 [Oscillospiraceae bacterium]|nr:hypothetical protein [Oscillospiraceae bacterium]